MAAWTTQTLCAYRDDSCRGLLTRQCIRPTRTHRDGAGAWACDRHWAIFTGARTACSSSPGLHADLGGHAPLTVPGQPRAEFDTTLCYACYAAALAAVLGAPGDGTITGLDATRYAAFWARRHALRGATLRARAAAIARGAPEGFYMSLWPSYVWWTASGIGADSFDPAPPPPAHAPPPPPRPAPTPPPAAAPQLPPPPPKRPRAPATHLSWWDILGVVADAPRDAVRAAFLAKARRWHPDRGGDAVMFAAVVEAWDDFKATHGYAYVPHGARAVRPMLCTRTPRVRTRSANILRVACS